MLRAEQDPLDLAEAMRIEGERDFDRAIYRPAAKLLAELRPRMGMRGNAFINASADFKPHRRFVNIRLHVRISISGAQSSFKEDRFDSAEQTRRAWGALKSG